MQRILIIRFSSIGDIVLTTPVIRVLRKAYPNADIRFVTKKEYADLVAPNPYLNGVFLLDDGLNQLAQKLKVFDPQLVIDLHHNLRTRILRTQVGGKWSAFKKLNVEKWLKVNLKVDKLPDIHVAERYLETLVGYDIKTDEKGLDFFFPKDFTEPVLSTEYENEYVGLVIGAKFNTKKLPVEQLVTICNKLNSPVILIGGKEDVELGNTIEEQSTANVYNSCGKQSLLGSAWLIKNATAVITHDTGMMHIAAAFNKKIVSVWGNTIPQFGMYPYMPQAKTNFFISEVSNLNCRPCSKIGFDKCPKGHFNCMQQQDVNQIIKQTHQFLSK